MHTKKHLYEKNTPKEADLNRVTNKSCSKSRRALKNICKIRFCKYIIMITKFECNCNSFNKNISQLFHNYRNEKKDGQSENAYISVEDEKYIYPQHPEEYAEAEGYIPYQPFRSFTGKKAE